MPVDFMKIKFYVNCLDIISRRFIERLRKVLNVVFKCIFNIIFCNYIFIAIQINYFVNYNSYYLLSLQVKLECQRELHKTLVFNIQTFFIIIYLTPCFTHKPTPPFISSISFLFPYIIYCCQTLIIYIMSLENVYNIYFAWLFRVSHFNKGIGILYIMLTFTILPVTSRFRYEPRRNSFNIQARFSLRSGCDQVPRLPGILVRGV